MGGEAKPVFTELTAGDPTTSYLTGFTITAGEGNEGKLAVVGSDVLTGG